MYQEDAERREHDLSLVENDMERRRGTGMVDMKRDDWIDEEANTNTACFACRMRLPWPCRCQPGEGA